MADFDPIDAQEIQDERTKRSPLWRILYIAVTVLIILVMVLNISGLSQWILIGRLSVVNLTGKTEAEILSIMGDPDFRSPLQVFIPGEGFGMVPQMLNKGDEFYFLNFIVGPRLYVFHLVSPETYEKQTGQIVLGDEWVVLEYYSGDRYVIY